MPMGWNSRVEAAAAAAAAADIPLQQGIRGSGSSGSVGWRKGPWTPEEDKRLSDYMSVHVEGRWSSVANSSGLNRSAKSCRLRWVNYLRPGLKRGQLTPQEEGIIIELHALLGNKWSTIARHLPGRTDNEIKNYWRTHFKKKDTTASKSSLLTKSFKQKLVKQQQQLSEDVEEEEEEYDDDEVPISRKDATAPAHTSVTNNHLISCTNQEYDNNTFSYQPPFELDDQVMYDRYAAATWTYHYLPQPEEKQVELWTGLWNLDDNSPPPTA